MGGNVKKIFVFAYKKNGDYDFREFDTYYDLGKWISSLKFKEPKEYEIISLSEVEVKAR